MRIVFDRNLETEHALTVDRVSERPLTGRLNASRSALSVEGAPNLAEITETFASVDLEDDAGAEIALAGNYTRVEDLSITWEDGGRSYFINLSLAESEAAE